MKLTNKKKNNTIQLYSVLLILTLIIFAELYFFSQNPKSESAFSLDDWDNPLHEESIIHENNYIYDNEIKVEEIYLTVLDVNIKKNPDIDSLAKMMFLSRDQIDNLDYKVEVYFENKSNLIKNIMFSEPNATIELKSNDVQKSFKLRLYENAGIWNRQSIINLKKNYDDPLRIRNKLSFDYLSILPNITSFDTRFVKLYIKELDDEEYEEYGLFTHIEQPNKQFLANHQLHPEGHLYTAENFNFSRYPDHIMDSDNPNYSIKKFEEILDIDGSDDHSKFIHMLDSINDSTQDANEFFANYFDKDNYLTWIASNILFDHYAASTTNYILYSPLNSQKWYFMPRDFEESWGHSKKRAPWQRGLAMFWDNELHRKIFENPESVKALNLKIEELTAIINKKQTQAFLDQYFDMVVPSITSLPDLKYLPVTIEEYIAQYKELPEMTERNQLKYHELLAYPMPFFLHEPYIENNTWVFTWDESYDIDKDLVSYTFELSRDKTFSEVLVSNKAIKQTSVGIDKLEDGIYYWRVTSMDTNGNKQIPFNTYTDEFGDEFYGIKKFTP